MPGPVERWLETFMCKQYADTFEAYGYQTLQSVCQLQMHQLLSMGVAREHCDNILENVHVLRQTMMGSMQQYPEDMPFGYDGDPQTRMNMQFPNRDNSGRVGMAGNVYGPHGNYSNQNQMLPQQRPHMQNQNLSTQQQHFNQMYRTPYPGTGPGSGYIEPRPEMTPRPDITSRQDITYSGMSPRLQNPNCNQRNPFPVTQVQGSIGANQSSVQQAHPHLRRNSGQTPQEVANNILQIASSNYPSHHTVQVPLSKSRPAPYQVPSRSPHYNMQQAHTAEGQYTAQVCQTTDYPSNKAFGYPNTSPHMIQHSRLSPISPNPGMIQSPHSHHSGHSLPNSSPHGSVHSPVPGGIRSPGSDRSSVQSPIMNTQPMTSPHGMSYQPLSSHHQHMTSPVPVNQQLQVSVPTNSSANRGSSMYSENVASPNQSHILQHQHSSHFSPTGNTMVSPGQFSNISSPYTPGSKASHHSPNLSYNVTSTSSQYLTDIGAPIDSTGQEGSLGSSNPLRSLQKLCMLPERQVVDPKSVVNDACSPSPQQNCDSAKNSDSDAASQESSSVKVGNTSEMSVASHTCADGNNCSPKNDDSKPEHDKEMIDSCSGNQYIEEKTFGEPENNTDTGKSDCIENDCPETNLKNDASEKGKEDTNAGSASQSHLKSGNEVHGNIGFEEMKCQPKKIILLRAAQDDAYKQSESSSKNVEIIGNQCVETKNGLTSSNEKCLDRNESSTFNTNIDKPDAKDIDKKIDLLENNQKVPDAAGVESEHSAHDAESTDKEFAVHKNSVDTNDTKDQSAEAFTGDVPTRTKSHNSGSLSDDFNNSDFDFEDHIGCDDLDNTFTSDDSIEKENIMDLDNTINKSDNCSLVKEIKNVIITENGCKVKLPSSPHWKKSKLNDLQALQHDKNQSMDDKTCDRSSSSRNCIKKPRLSSRVRNIKKTVNCGIELNGHDSDSDGYCSNDNIDNSDGTLVVSKRVTTRKRKQPLKYKDTSFFQGDFIFAEEEENYSGELKKKMKKSNLLSSDKNHEKKNPSNIDKPKKSKTPLNKNGLSKSHQQMKDCIVKIELKSDIVNEVADAYLLGVKKNTSKQKEQSCDDIKVNGDVNNSAEVDNKNMDEHYSLEENCDNDISEGKERKENHKTEIEVSNLAKARQTGSNTKKSVKKTNTSKGSANKGKSEASNIRQSSRQSAKLARRSNNFKFGDTVDGVISVKEEKEFSEKVICTPSKNKTDGKFKDALNKSVDQEDKNKDQSKEVILDLTNSDHEVVGVTNSVNCDKKVNKCPVKKEATNKVVIKSIKQKAKLKSTVKKQNCRKRNRKQKMNAYNNDSDYEAGPNRESLKSLKLNKTHDLMSKKKKHEKHSFKGPMIHIEGSKENPEKCAVVNQPLQEADLKTKRAKTVVQNVSSVEISHLPSDKSICIPNSETEESGVWVCALCGKHSSYKFLGDLFGPYTVEVPMEGEKTVSPKHSASSRGGRTKSEDSVSSSGLSNRSGKPGHRLSKETSTWKEVWVHECCSTWADGVFLIGSKIYGLQEAAKIASKTVCSHCHEHGAIVGCLHKGCQMKFHHSCAMEEDCILDEENFSLLCPKHKSKKLRKPDPSFSSWG